MGINQGHIPAHKEYVAMASKTKTIVSAPKRSLSAAATNEAPDELSMDDVEALFTDKTLKDETFFAAYKNVHGKDSTLEHDDLVQLVQENQYSMEEFGEEDWARVMDEWEQLKAEDNVPRKPITEEELKRSLSAAHFIHSKAVDIGHKLDNAAVKRELEDYGDTEVKRMRVAITLSQKMAEILTPEVFRDCPFPGTAHEDVGENTVVDRYKYLDKANNNRKTTGHFWQETLDATPWGADLLNRKNQLQLFTARNAGEVKVDSLLPEYQHLDKTRKKEAQTLLAGVNTRRRAQLAALSKAAKYWLNKDRIEREFKKVGISVMKVRKLNPKTKQYEVEDSDSPQPIHLINKEDDTQYAILTTQQVGAFDLDEAKENGGTFDAIYNTIRRGQGSGEPEDQAKLFNIGNVDDAWRGIHAIGNFFVNDDGEMIPDRYAAIKQKLKVRDKTQRDDNILRVGRVALAFKFVWDMIGDDYNELINIRDTGHPNVTPTQAKAIAARHNQERGRAPASAMEQLKASIAKSKKAS